MVPGSMMRLSGPDNINLFNGNLSLSIPLGQTYPVSDTLSYSFVLRYNSNIWDFTEGWDGEVVVQAHPAFFSNAGTGWRLSLGDLLAPGDWYNTGNPSNAWVYLAPDGSSHRFYSLLHRGEASGGGLYTRDGSYLRLQFVAFDASEDPIKIDIEMPSGNTHTFELKSDWDVWRLTEMRDRFGNSVDFSYVFPNGREVGDLECTITDETGRLHVLFYERYSHPDDSLPRYSLISMSLAAFGGHQACFAFEYLEEEIERSYKHDDPGMDYDVVVPLLQSVTFPDGGSNPCDIAGCSDCTTTDFTYLLTGDPAGLLESMRLPTGGVVDWQYGLYTFPQGNVSCYDQGEPWNHAIMGGATGVTRRRLFGDAVDSDGTWSYTPVDNGGISIFRSVASPDGTRVDHFFNTGIELCADEGDWRGWAYGLPFLPGNAVDSGGISIEIYAPDAGTTDPPIRRISVNYRHDQLPSYTSGVSPQSFHNTNRRLQSRTKDYLDDERAPDLPRWEGFTLHNFDGLGHYRRKFSDGNFFDAPSQLVFAGYNPAPGGGYYQYSIDEATNEPDAEVHTFPSAGYPVDAPWILNTVDFKWTQKHLSPNPPEENRTEYCFDRGTHGAFLAPTTGFLNGLRIHVDEDPASDDRSPNDIIKRFTESSIFPGRVGAERYYGAEAQAIPIDPLMSACDVDGLFAEYKITHQYSYGALSASSYNLVPAQEGQVVTLFTRAIDSNTGLTAMEIDTSGYSTDFSYDQLGRLTEAVPVDGAKTTLTYTPASGSGVNLVKATVHQQAIAQDDSVLAESDFTFDAFGRGEKESHLLADGTWNQRISGYDALDRLTWITEWQPDGTTPANYSKTENADFDAFGRVGTVTLPDGHEIDYDYTGRRLVSRTATVGTTFDDVDTVTEVDTTTTTTLDRNGRPLKVEEPSGTNGLMIPTDYRYDVGGNLKWAQTTASGTSQTREFNYNGLGFLTSSLIPEKSADTIYSGYDPMGNVGTVVDGPSDLSYGYDFASRLITITDNNVAGVPFIGLFSYHSEGGGIPGDRDGGAWSEGKLASATRVNLFEAGGPWDQVDVAETYEYNGLGGAVSRKQTDITLGTGTTTESFEQSWTYTDLGNVATTTYPEEVDAAALPDLVVENGYSHGWLTSVTPGVEEIWYFANGMIEFVGNPGEDPLIGIGFERDPDWMQRPRQISFIGYPHGHGKSAAGDSPDGGIEPPPKTNSWLSFWDSGEFEYDGLGNLTAQKGYWFHEYGNCEQGSRFFEYDQVSRLKSLMTSTSDPSPEYSYQTAYSYDPFGNIVSRTLDGETYTYETDPSNNHLSGAGVTYDLAGNQKEWFDYDYQYTPFHQIQKYSANGPHQFYAYSADNERVVVYDSAELETSLMLRDLDAKVLRTLRLGDSGAEWERDYLYRGRVLMGAKSPTQDFRLFADHLGSVRLVTDWDDWTDIVEVNNYSPFGSEFTNDVLGTDQKLRFTGHERDLMDPTHTTDDLDYMHARHYNLNLARFLSVDPVGGDSFRPQSWNGYSYVLNNPLRFTDFSGETIHVVYDANGSGLTDMELKGVFQNVGIMFDEAGVDIVFHSKGSGTAPSAGDLGSNDRLQILDFVSPENSTSGPGTYTRESHSVVLVDRSMAKDAPAGGLIFHLSNATGHELGHGTGVLLQYGWHDPKGMAAISKYFRLYHSQPLGAGFYLDPLETVMDDKHENPSYLGLFSFSSEDKTILEYYFGRANRE